MSLSNITHFARLCSKVSRRFLTSRQLVYEKYGDPLKVLELKAINLSKKLEPKKVYVRWLAAPVNPADINQIQGVYPIKPNLPAVGGSEGIGEVVTVGDEVNNLKSGDWVIVIRSGVGTWQSCGYYDVDDLVKISKDLPLEVGATLQVNPPTAYRMLIDFVNLHPGDLVVQNGATSSVGRAVIQIAHALGLRTLNVIRKSSSSQQTAEQLKMLGADEVYTEDEMLSTLRGKVKDAKLALNCVGGRSTLALASCLSKNGVLVTYGGMSKQPLQIPTGPLIFKNIKIKGFWMTEWYRNPKNKQERTEMFTYLAGLVRQGKFRAPDVDKRSLDDWKIAMEKTLSGTGKKQLFVL